MAQVKREPARVKRLTYGWSRQHLRRRASATSLALMKSFVVVTFCLAVLVACAGNTSAQDDGAWPKTVDEAASQLRRRLSAEDLEWIRRNPKDVVTSELHLPYGTGVRNEFGLWGKNHALLKSCGSDYAEECSSIIFSALWEKVRSETDPALSKSLDCHFAALDRIEIDTAGWYQLQLGQLLANLQLQIDRQDILDPGCNEEIRIVTRGDPDLQCFVRVEYEERNNLKRLFQWVGFRNAFSVTHDPPNIELNFNQQCAWSERPMHFTPKGKE